MAINFIALVGIVGIFYEARKREVPDVEAIIVTAPSGENVSFNVTGMKMSSDLGTDESESGSLPSRIFTAVFFSGAKILYFAVKTLKKRKRLQVVDISSCCRVLMFLAAAGKKKSFQEIADNVTKIDLETTMTQIADIDGVFFLGMEPAGVSLSERLSREVKIVIDQI
ncbi:MAG: hypothetical protein NUW37_16405 [Planctomycetes bacterium]|nr:hypothetical protein [Planctomycetota bacterium]